MGFSLHLWFRSESNSFTLNYLVFFLCTSDAILLYRESEYHFVSKRGRQDLVAQAKFQRLAIVYLNRAHKYEDLDSILAELSPKIKELAPKSLPENYKVIPT